MLPCGRRLTSVRSKMSYADPGYFTEKISNAVSGRSDYPDVHAVEVPPPSNISSSFISGTPDWNRTAIEEL